MSDHVGEIKSRLNIADVVGGYIKLEKMGGNLKARCPFHNEKTPSFFISPDRGTYYCFGCGAKGDIFSFVQEFEGLDFMGSLKVLAERAGVELSFEKRDPGVRNEKERLFALMEAVTAFYQRTLYENAAGAYKEVIEYLLGRGLTKETIKAWRIGYAPLGWQNALDYLRRRGFSEKEIIAAGIAKRREAGESESDEGAPVAGAAASTSTSTTSTTTRGLYDRFRGRIMFPLFDSSGRVVAFSGRIFPDDKKSAKYLNSPETPLWHKSHFLFGMHKAKHGIREKGFAILVEGQMDIIMAHQTGWTNTMASSGTALTAEHLATIRRFTDYVRMAFDPDSAGVKAALRSARIAVGMGLDVRLIELPTGKDPADLARDDAADWSRRIEGALKVTDFFLHRIEETKPDARTLGVMLREQVLPFVAVVPNAIEKTTLVSDISRRTGVKEDAIWEEIRKLPADEAIVMEQNPKPVTPNAAATPTMSQPTANRPLQAVPLEVLKSRRNHVEERLIGLYFSAESKKADTVLTSIKAALIDCDLGDDFISKLTSTYEPRREELMLQAEMLYTDKEFMKKDSKYHENDIKELVRNLAEDMIKEELATTLTEVVRAEKAKDSALLAKLLGHCKMLSDKLAKMRLKN